MLVETYAKLKNIGWVTGSIISRDRHHVMLNIYKSLICPNLEYCVQLWNPVPKHGNWATIMELESVQPKFTILVDGIGLMPYEERLSKTRKFSVKQENLYSCQLMHIN